MSYRKNSYFLVATFLFIAFAYSINFDKFSQTKAHFYNPTHDRYLLFVKSNNTQNTQEKKYILQPDEAITVDLKTDRIKQVKAINQATGKLSKLHAFQNSSGLIMYYMQEPDINFDRFHANFDIAIDSKSKHYNDAIHNRHHWYSLNLWPDTTPAEFLALARKLHNSYFPPNNPFLAVKPDNQARIPKKIHQIWLGPKELPEKFKHFQQKWKQMHPEWEYVLWTDESVKNLFPLRNQHVYDKAPNYASKADIVRFEALYKYGGVYLDIDTEPWEKLDSLVHSFDFWALLFGPYQGTLLTEVLAFGTVPGHPILAQTIENIQEAFEHPLDYSRWSTDKNFVNTLRFGVTPFSKAICKKAGKTNFRDILLPAYYFGNYFKGPFSYATHYPTQSWRKEPLNN